MTVDSVLQLTRRRHCRYVEQTNYSREVFELRKDVVQHELVDMLTPIARIDPVRVGQEQLIKVLNLGKCRGIERRE